MSENKYDICVIGGGIQGVGSALLAARCGYKVVLVEQNTLGSATSSKSSKLIHGGLRYLQTAQFKLVRECLHERRWMLDNLPKHAPGLIKANWFYIPIYQHSHYPGWKIFIGLALYRLLAGFGPNSQFKRLKKDEITALPGLKAEGLKAVYAYQDAQTDDLQLTKFTGEQASKYGVDIFEQCTFESAEHNGENYTIKLTTQTSGAKQLQASLIVNAGGPWVNEILAKIKTATPLTQDNYDLVQGAHLVCEPQLSEQCFYLEAPKDQRAVFMLPFHGKTLIGTTETRVESPDNPQAQQQEIDYLLDVAKHYFPNYTPEIKSTMAGLRVLPASDKSAFKRSREVQISAQQNVISLCGGKLTSWRVSAIKVLEITEQLLGKRKDFGPDQLFED